MKQDEIIKLAREAGFSIDGDSWIHPGAVLIDGRKSIDKQLKNFANLVAAHKAEVITAEAYRCGVLAGSETEREACAKVCEDEEELQGHTPFDCALRIRARGENT
jgi:hypothetical protein